MNLDKAKTLAERLIKEKNLDYTFFFDTSISRFGRCNNTRKIISLSQELTLLNNEEKVRSVILHEIAHALTKQGHTQEFYSKCIELGISPQRCYGREVLRPTFKWLYNCPKGCIKGGRYKRLKRAICPKCRSKIKWTKL